MNAFSYSKCWNFGKLIKEEYQCKWTEIEKMSGWIEFKAKHGLTDNQLFYIRRGFMGRPFQDDSEPTQNPLDDEICPMGAFKGKRFREITPKYLLWLYSQEWLDKWPNLSLYVKRWKSEQEATQLSKEEIKQALKLD